MYCRLLLAAIAVSLVFVSGSAEAARIVVTVDGMHSAQGNVFIGLYASPGTFLNGTQCDGYKKVKASTGPITVAFDNLRPGTYAVGAYHDENGNAQLDTGPLGLPIEGYALSNGVRAVLAKPSFYQAAFTLGDGVKPVSLQIRY